MGGTRLASNHFSYPNKSISIKFLIHLQHPNFMHFIPPDVMRSSFPNPYLSPRWSIICLKDPKHWTRKIIFFCNFLFIFLIIFFVIRFYFYFWFSFSHFLEFSTLSILINNNISSHFVFLSDFLFKLNRQSID